MKFGYSGTYRLEDPAVAGVRHYFTGLIERDEQSFEQPDRSDGA